MHSNPLARAMVAVLTFALSAPVALADTEKDQPKGRTDALGDPLPRRAIARLGTQRMRGCQGPVAFSPDGKYLVMAGGNGGTQAICWDISTGQRVKALTAGGNIMQFAFSPDGKLLAAAHNGGYFCSV